MSEQTPKKGRTNGRATRAKILRAAQSILLGEGSDFLSIDRIIARAEISKGAFMYHFPSRNALLDALTEPMQTQMPPPRLSAGAVSDALEQSRAENARERLATLLSLYFAERQRCTPKAALRAQCRSHLDALNDAADEASAADSDNGFLRAFCADAAALYEALGIALLSDEEKERLTRFLDEPAKTLDAPKQ